MLPLKSSTVAFGYCNSNQPLSIKFHYIISAVLRNCNPWIIPSRRISHRLLIQLHWPIQQGISYFLSRKYVITQGEEMAHCPYKCIACTTTQRDPQGAEKYSTLHLPSFLHSGMNVPTQALHWEHHPRFVSPFRCCTVIIISRIAVTAFSLMRLIYYLLLAPPPKMEQVLRLFCPRNE